MPWECGSEPSCGSAGVVLSSSRSLFHDSWAMGCLVLAQVPWHRPGRACRRWSGDVWWWRSPGRGHSQSSAAAMFPWNFPRASQAPDTQQNAPILRFAACLPCLIPYLVSLPGLLLSEEDPCPVQPLFADSQLWLFPVPLPYALAATPLLLFCTHSLCNKLDTESPISKFWGQSKRTLCHLPKKKKKRREKELTCTVFIREI